MGSVDRLTRVNELLKREIAEVLERNPVRGGSSMLVSITMVKCSVDLRNATVFVSVFGGGPESGANVLKHLHHFRSDLQRKIAKDLGFKHTPVLSFKLDSRLAAGDRVLEILNDSGEETDDTAQ